MENNNVSDLSWDNEWQRQAPQMEKKKNSTEGLRDFKTTRFGDQVMFWDKPSEARRFSGSIEFATCVAGVLLASPLTSSKSRLVIWKQTQNKVNQMKDTHLFCWLMLRSGTTPPKRQNEQQAKRWQTFLDLPLLHKFVSARKTSRAHYFRPMIQKVLGPKTANFMNTGFWQHTHCCKIRFALILPVFAPVPHVSTQQTI